MTILREFFGNFKHEFGDQAKNDRDVFSKKSELNDEQFNDLWWFILDHDDIHVDHVLPLAKKVSNLQTKKKFDHGKFIKEWMPIVNKACVEYYKSKKMSGDLNDIFTIKIRKDMCHRLADHFHNDIEKGEYKLGESKKFKNKKIKEIGQAQMASPSGPQYDTSGNNSLEEAKKKKKKTKQRLDPKCWKGYRKQGTKMKGGVRVNNCVKVGEGWQIEINKLVKLLENKS